MFVILRGQRVKGKINLLERWYTIRPSLCLRWIDQNILKVITAVFLLTFISQKLHYVSMNLKTN